MQSLPVTAAPPLTPPSAPAQAPTPTDSAAPAVEPFGNVLARQRANASTPQDSKQPDNKQPASSADASATAAVNDPASELPIPIPDAASTLSGDLLAALLPAATVTSSPATKEKTDPQVPTPDGTSTLPSDMLAMLLPAAAAAAASTAAVATAAASSAVSNGKGVPEAIQEGGKKIRPQPIATAAPGEARPQSTGDKAASEIPVGASPRAQGHSRPEAANTDTGKGNSFSAALEALGKDGAKTAQLDANATKVATQPVESTALNGLLQSGVAPIAASQNGSAQAVQAAINTPVTHEAWGDEFNQKITWMATQHEQTAELHLNPPNLGPLDVVLKVSGDQATALFTSPHAAVREAVEQALPKLRDMMADNGITLGNAMVSDQSPKDQQAWQADQRQKGSGRTAGGIDATAAIGGIPSGAVVSSGRRHQGMVDTFA